MGLKNILGLLCLGFTAFAAAETPVYTYYVSHVPKYYPTCVAAADAVGQNFANVTGVKTYESRCAYEHSDGYDVKIVYSSDVPLKKVSTVVDEEPISGYVGSYSTRESCEKALPAEIEAFTTATGLTPVVHYCYPAPYIGSTQPFALRIDAFGDAKQQPYSYEDTIAGTPEVGNKVVIEAVQKGLTQQGINVRQVFIRHDSMMFDRLNIRYYATAPVAIWNLSRFNFDDAKRCASQLDEINAAVAAFNVTPLAAFCGAGKAGWINVILGGNIPFELAAHDWPYTSFDDCYAHRSEVIQSYQAKMKWDVRGAVCEGRFNDYRLNLFKTP